MTRAPYYGPVEALTLEEAATRVRVGLDHFRRSYTGRIVRIGANVRVTAADLAAWLDGLASGNANGDPWGGVGDAETGSLSRRKPGEAA